MSGGLCVRGVGVGVSILLLCGCSSSPLVTVIETAVRLKTDSCVISLDDSVS